MSRRRLTLTAYVRRRWRVVGAIVVMLLGALLVLAVTDRGHDPAWQARASELDHAAFAPDGRAEYALLREGGNISRIAAYGEDGALRWEGEVDAPRARLAAGPAGVAVATAFPLAFLTVYGTDGSIQWQVPLEGVPVAVIAEDDVLALALDAPSLHHPVLVFKGARLVHTFLHASPVSALDMAAGVVAVAGANGDVVARTLDAREVANVTLGFTPRSLRLAEDGTALVVGGGLTAVDAPGHVAFIDVGADAGVRWQQDTPAGIGLVDLDAAGLRALAVEEAPPSAILHVYDGSTGATRWNRLLPGGVARDDAGVFGGAAISPDATRVAVGTVRGNVQLFDARSGEAEWTYRAGGVAVLDFADDEGQRLLVGGRLLANQPFDSLFLFSTTEEPAGQEAAILATTLVALAVASLALFLGVGFWRARGTY